MGNRWRYILTTLGLLAVATWLAVIVYPKQNLRIIACDVGQGDAILAIYGKTQILIDGGPSNQVLDCLGRYIPYWDREIEVIVLTHPQKDHYQGLIEVFRRYQVEMFVANSLDSSNQGYQVLKSVVGGSGARVVNPTTSMVIRLGMIYLDIVHPSEEFLVKNQVNKESQSDQGVLGVSTSKRDSNEFSIVLKLSLDEFSALFTGDVEPRVIDEVVQDYSIGDVEYIKIPHHGSKNGLTQKLLNETTPELAIISVGRDNRYGHPHQEILDLLINAGIQIKRTDLDGDIEVVTDGETWEIK